MVDGLLLINKPKGYTSRDVVNIISKYYNSSKVGHTGTLDPNATGVLVVALGKALKIIDFLTMDDKEYKVRVKMGILTDTLDEDGNIIKEDNNYVLDKCLLDECLNSFLGKYNQEVPKYSAVKVNGKRLYEYAREGRDVTLPVREVNIKSISLLELNQDSFSFRVVVSKGTYIRSLVRDIGSRLNILCTMSDLVRIRQGKYKIEDCVSISCLDKVNVISIKDALSCYYQVVVDDFIADKVLNGRILENRYDVNKVVFVNKSGDVLAIYEVYKNDNSKVKPIKVFK